MLQNNQAYTLYYYTHYVYTVHTYCSHCSRIYPSSARTPPHTKSAETMRTTRIRTKNPSFVDQ